MFHQLSQEALRITAEINGKYHTPEELHALLEQLWGREVPKMVGMFPPFHTDCGKNTVVGERVFINMGHDSELTTQIYLASLETSVVDKANRMILSLL